MEPIVVQNAVEEFADFLLNYFVALAAVGALAMALIELWKALRDSRTRYHSIEVSRWIEKTYRALGAEPKGLPTDVNVSDYLAYAELLHLTTGVNLEDAKTASIALRKDDGIRAGWFWVARMPEYALFALELERMLGHIQDAAEMALNNPKTYPSLYLFMTAGGDLNDIETWYSQASQIPTGEGLSRDQAKRRADLYARLNQIAKRKLDAFQLYTGYQWVNWNQLWSNVVGFFVLLGTLLWIKAYDSASAENLSVGAIVLLSLLGGMLAPIAKDIVVALRKVRQGG